MSNDIKNVVLIPVSLDDFRQMLRDTVQSEVSALIQQASKPGEQEDELLTIKQASEKAKVSRVTLNAWIKKGWLTPVRLGTAVRIRRNDLMRIDTTKKQRGTSL